MDSSALLLLQQEEEADEECQTILSCKTDELSKKAASAFIQHLQDLQRQQEIAINQPLRKVG